MHLLFALRKAAAISIVSITSVGCAVDAAPSTDPAPADRPTHSPAQVATTSGRPIVDSTPVPAEVGTILSKVMTAEGRTFQFGRAPSDAIWVVEESPLGTPPALAQLSKLHPSVLDIFREVSGAAEIPGELWRPMAPAPVVPAPPPMVRSDFVIRTSNDTLTSSQLWFELTVCLQSQIGGFYGNSGACLIGDLDMSAECPPTPSGGNFWLNSPCSPDYIEEFGTYYAAAMLDPSCSFLDYDGKDLTWLWNGSSWQIDVVWQPWPGSNFAAWINDPPGVTYRFTSQWWGPNCPGGVAMGTGG
jgi:hypothetical protein